MKIEITIPDVDKDKWVDAYKAEFNYDRFKDLSGKPLNPQDFMEQKMFKIITNVYKKYQVNSGKIPSLDTAKAMIDKVTISIVEG
jgi:hypothetical protein